MKRMKKLLRDRKGISITEVVVAMAMVLLITGAALTLLVASMKSDAKYLAKSTALNACENAVECVRFADDTYTLTTALSRVGFQKTVDPADPNGYFTKFFLTSGDHTVRVNVSTNAEFEIYVVVYNDSEIYTAKKPK